MEYDALYEAVDCTLGGWVGWGKCSQICGGGVQERIRKVLKPASGLGTYAPPLSLSLQGAHR